MFLPLSWLLLGAFYHRNRHLTRTTPLPIPSLCSQQALVVTRPKGCRAAFSWLERHPVLPGLWTETLQCWEQLLGCSLPRGEVWDVHLSKVGAESGVRHAQTAYLSLVWG